MKEPVLVILAAGMGSRYGGLKQIDTVGSNGESIIDFSIYDALEAGFKRLFLIIRKEHQKAFEESLGSKVSQFMEVVYCYQNLEDVPSTIKVPEGREKPWGTTHALLAIKDQIDAPFMIINADDYYGKDSFKKMYSFLTTKVTDTDFAMVGYVLENTLTDHGTVTRAICNVEDGCLSEIIELDKIAKRDGYAVNIDENNQEVVLPKNSLVSMNYWGFTPKVLEYCQPIFEKFLEENIDKNPMKCEHVIPTAVRELILDPNIKVHMLSSDDKWFGVTYKEDKPLVVESLQEYKDNGLYPFDLWKK